MVNLREDPIVNAIYGGIKKGIQVAINNECLDSAVVLIISGIDSMAYLNMPADQEDVTKYDFITWAEQYIKFSCKEQLTGLDLYGARCAMLHSFGVVSKLSREGKCRMVGYMDKSIPEVRYNPNVSKELVMVSVPALAESFFQAIDKFMVDLFSNPTKAKVAEKRLHSFVQKLPTEKNR
jgi:hypothetical protein